MDRRGVLANSVAACRRVATAGFGIDGGRPKHKAVMPAPDTAAHDRVGGAVAALAWRGREVAMARLSARRGDALVAARPVCREE